MAALLARRPHWYRARRVLHVAAEGCLGTEIEKWACMYLAPRSCNLCKLPFRDGLFDLIIHNHVMEHVLDDARAFHEQRRLLAPGGRLLLTTPTRAFTSETSHGGETAEQRRQRWGHPKHWRIYGRDDLVDRLRAAGYESAGCDDVRRWDPPVEADQLGDGLIFWARAGKEPLS